MLAIMSTSAQLPLCIYCGTARPADRSECPQCGRPWIDVRVGTLAESRVHALIGAAATTETPNVSAIPAIDPIGGEDEPNTDVMVDLTDDDAITTAPATFRRAIPIVLGLSAVAVVAMFGLGLLDEEPSPDPDEIAVLSTTLPPPNETPVTAAPTTTTPPPTTVPTTTIPASSEIGVFGDPVPISRLTLKADGIGPIEVGTPASEAIGRLVASLGTPEAIGIAGQEYGLCADEDGRVIRWAELNVIVSGTLVEGLFVGYRYEEQSVPTGTIDLATPSGIRLGDDIATLNEVYARYSISYETVGGESTFRLSQNEELLLWGLVSSTEENGRIEGIYSPPACGSS
jgi:hypothetical protein